MGDLSRPDVLDATLEPACLGICVRSKLHDKSSIC
jgi:hypothetical protein